MNRQAIALSLGLTLAGTTLAQATVGTATITVLPDHYVFAGRVYDDLGRLEDAVRALRPNDIALNSCGPRETRVMVAAAHRLRDLPTRIHFLNVAEDAACSPPAISPARLAKTGGPTGIDDRAVSEYWYVLLP